MNTAKFVCKVNDLEDLEYYQNGTTPEPFVIAEEKVLNPAEFNYFLCNMIEDYEWLAGKGGHEGNARKVIKVSCEGFYFSILVDPQGYDYPRYAAKVSV